MQHKTKYYQCLCTASSYTLILHTDHENHNDWIFYYAFNSLFYFIHRFYAPPPPPPVIGPDFSILKI